MLPILWSRSRSLFSLFFFVGAYGIQKKEKKTSVCLSAASYNAREACKTAFDSANHHRPREKIKNLRFFSLTSV